MKVSSSFGQETEFQSIAASVFCGLYLQEMVKALVTLFAVFVDARRVALVKRLERLNIRLAKRPLHAPEAKKIERVVW